jgi:hypothetical protein
MPHDTIVRQRGQHVSLGKDLPEAINKAKSFINNYNNNKHEK